ncbi:TrkH family potassium uptake protein [Thiohalobacter sp.]|uniref:TrkH family potassium uptake protein n=1 Tax=Thiohalobacter sp. TaxID=2025948 RepID=UPI00263A2599|nr:TrkH family potassium uptake protein [Thiohalobacter sp.]
MQLVAIQRILGLLLILFSSTMLPPVVVSLVYDDGSAAPFLDAFGLILLAGLIFWLPVRRHQRELRLRDGFLVVVLFWAVLGLVGAVPFALSENPHMSLTDSVFESLSGLTTTGATVITGIDHLPPSILFYRQELQWLGGMGIIVLAVAVLPMLGIGGMQLYRAETPGPMKDSKLTPRITETAKALWYIYLSLTVACALAYWLAGMEPFDAIAHSFSTVAIGGFSTHDLSIGYFQNQLIETVAVVFMLLSGINFALHFTAWRALSLRPYAADSEVRTYFAVLGGAALITVAYLAYTETFDDWSDTLHHGIFQVVSIGTTTGFTTTAYHVWPGFLPVLLLFISFIGGCAGSTGGGMKVIRFLLLVKQGAREVRRLVHPSAQIPVKVNNKPMPDAVMDAVWGFFATYIAAFAVMMLILMATGLDQVTAFSAVAACINNLGPGLGEVGFHYADLNDLSKWVLSFAMLLGRLEIFTLLVLLTPAFWRR